MRVFFIINVGFPYGMATVKRFICLAKAIISQGIDIKVICFSRTEIKGSLVQNTQSKGVFEGIPFEYVGGKTIRNANPFLAKCETQILLYLLYVKLLFTLRKGDIAYISTNEKFAGHMNTVVRIAHLKGAKAIRGLCEVPGKAGESAKKDKLKHFTLEKCFPNFDGFVAISESLVSLAQQYMKPSAKIIKVPILVDFDEYNMDDMSGESEVPYIFHAGTLYERKDGILGMIEAFGMACARLDKPIKFICTGNKKESPHRKEIEALIEKYQLQDRLVFTGFVSNEQLKEYLQKASIVIVNKKPNQQNTYCFSTKLGEYMAAGKAVVITKVGEAMNWLSDDKDALIVPPCENDLLADAIVRLFSDDALRQRLGENTRVTCKENFDYRNWGHPLKNYLEQLL